MTSGIRGLKKLDLVRERIPSAPASDSVSIDVPVDGKTGDLLVEVVNTGSIVAHVFGDDDREC